MSSATIGPPTPLRLSPRAAEVVSAARLLLERDGFDALTMRRLADDLDMRAPSIYKHLANKHAIEVALIEVALAEMGVALRAAVADWDASTAIPDLLHAYRRQGRHQPNLYRLATAGPLARDELTPGLEAWAGEPFFLVTGESSLAQALWSFAHGMVILEIDDRYPAGSKLDQTWASGAAAFQAEAATRQLSSGSTGSPTRTVPG